MKNKIKIGILCNIVIFNLTICANEINKGHDFVLNTYSVHQTLFC